MKKQALTFDTLMAKADRAATSARLLLKSGDMDGAANRAYYAMFDAARAALLASGAPVDSDVAKTHSGLISAFGIHLVKNGPVSKDVGKILNRGHELRLVADYNGRSVTRSDAHEMVEQAETFVMAMKGIYITISKNVEKEENHGVEPEDPTA